MENEKTWIKYSPENVDIKYHTKMNLRNMLAAQELMGGNINLKLINKSEYGDDEYLLGDVKIIARENGQETYEGDINETSGIFFFSNMSEKIEVENKLVKLLK